MVLVLAKAAGCSWTTVKELLLMYVAERDLQPDDLEQAFERYKKLTQETARHIINFYRQRVKVRAQKTGGATIGPAGIPTGRIVGERYRRRPRP